MGFVEGGLPRGASAGGATSYANLAEMRAAAAALSDGDLGKVTGVDGAVLEIKTAKWTPDPLACGVPIPGPSIGKDAAHGWSDEVGTASVDATGITISANDNSAAMDSRFGEAAATFPRGQAVNLSTLTLDSGRSLRIEAVFDLTQDTSIGSKDILLAIGLHKDGDQDTGVVAAAYRFEANAGWRPSVREYDEGTRTTNTPNTKLTEDFLATEEIQIVLTVSDFGLRCASDLYTGSEQKGAEKTLASDHALVVHLKTSSPEIVVYMAAYASDATPASEFTAKLKSLSIS